MEIQEWGCVCVKDLDRKQLREEEEPGVRANPGSWQLWDLGSAGAGLRQVWQKGEPKHSPVFPLPLTTRKASKGTRLDPTFFQKQP